MSHSKIWLIGTGVMAIDYVKVLKSLNKEFIVIGRGETNAAKFEELMGIKPIVGGVNEAIRQLKNVPDYVINSVGIDQLADVSKALFNFGVKYQLIEKPGIAYANEVFELNELAKKNKIQAFLAYNRRFYTSVIEARKIIEQDGGVKSFNFEFTEWSHSIDGIRDVKTDAELNNWFLGNSTHVIDMAFYLGGTPKEIKSFFSGKDLIDWHKTSSNYSGAGISKNGALFSYHANWKAPGRFSVEILTDKHRLIFRPLEKLQIQNIGSVAINFVENIDYSIDEKYKPGLYLQTKAFLENDFSDFCSLQEQADKMDMYKQMSGY